MAFDFPNSPSEGTTFAPSGGPVYVYMGGVWRMQGSGQVVTAEARNRIVNGAMQIGQEFGGTLIGDIQASANPYGCDQWRAVLAATTAVASVQLVSSTTPNKSRNRLRFSVTTTKAVLAAGDLFYATQPIEGIRISDCGFGAAGARQLVLRFGFKGPAGSYSASINNGDFSRAYTALFTISAGQANTDTEQIIVIPGDIAGTWPNLNANARGFIVNICFAAGTSGITAPGVWTAGGQTAATGQTNGLATAGNVFELFDVGLYLDPNATGTPPPWQMPDEAQELAACQRYYTVQTVGFRTTPASVIAYAAPISLLPMRIAPTTVIVAGTRNNVSAASVLAATTTLSLPQYNNTAAGDMIVNTDTIKLNARM